MSGISVTLTCMHPCMDAPGAKTQLEAVPVGGCHFSDCLSFLRLSVNTFISITLSSVTVSHSAPGLDIRGYQALSNQGSG